MIKIVGAGMAGLLAANLLRSRDEVVVYERQSALPHNHSAVLRFRTPLVGEVLGIPFRKVTVIKSVERWRNAAADSLAYSLKCLGMMRTDRSIARGEEVVERWIAPPDLVERMARGVDVRYGVDFNYDLESGDGVRIISTIPMPVLMGVLRYPDILRTKFRWVPGVNVRAKLKKTDAYVSLSVPSPDLLFSRVSITGDELIVEVPGIEYHERLLNGSWAGLIAQEAAALLGVNLISGSVEVRGQAFSKIVPIEEEERRRFLFWCSTIEGHCWNLGRYATWRPGLLLDDLINDVRVITRLMDDGSGFEAQRMEVRS